MNADIRVRRAGHGWRSRIVVACSQCGGDFVRLSNTQFCSDICRLMHKVGVRDGCWIWQATVDRHGYGTFYLGGNGRAHRIAYELLRGPIPDGLELDHLCRNRACVNPDHLEPVTRAENIRRGMRWPAKESA